MTSLLMLFMMVVLFTGGFFMMMDRSLTRILLGFLLVGNGVNLLIFAMSGSFGSAPIVDGRDPELMSDPLPQAFILTAIVITFGVTAFVLAMIYRTWLLDRAHDDEVLTDAEDFEVAHHQELLPSEEVSEDELSEVPEYESENDSDDDTADGRGSAAFTAGDGGKVE